MPYAKINNNQIVKYPYTLQDLQKDYPNVSFPYDPDRKTLKAYGADVVLETNIPVVQYYQNVSEGAPIFSSGYWKQTWVVTNKPAKEVEELAKFLRADAYREESDPLYFKSQRGEATLQQWKDKVKEIQDRYPGVIPQ
jgi:ABC-type Fe3+-hydroxamate transport system substrate-binding protein